MQLTVASFAAVFGAGLISFLSPCILPLVPGYLSFVTGLSLEEMKEKQGGLAATLVPSLLFVLGFTIIFMALGATASILGSFLAPYRSLLGRAAGVLIILMGVLMLGVIKIPSLYGEMRFDPARARTFGRGASLVMGMAFAFGWTPCVGPILASVLTLAGSSADLQRGALLLLTYSAGLAVPFVLTAVLFARLQPAVRLLTRHSVAVNRVAGVLLIVMGVLMLTNKLVVVGGWLLKFLPAGIG